MIIIDSKKKSILKTLSWRFFALIITITVVYVFTRSITVSLGLSLTANLLSMIGYYFHERLWSRYE